MQVYPRWYFTFAFNLVALWSFSQDPTFSQFDANQLYYNPAYAGYREEARIGLTYRDLWPSVPGREFPGPLATYSATGDAAFSIQNKFNAGAGVFVMQDEEGQGLLTTTSAGVMYSQHMPNIRARNDKMDRFNIYLGFKAYYNYIHVDWNRFVFSDQLNPDLGITGTSSFNQEAISSRSYFDLDFGVLVRNNFKAKGRWYNELGFAMSHVLAPSIALTGSNSDAARLPRKYVATYRSNIALQGDYFYLGPTVLFENQAQFYSVNAGLDFYLRLNSKRETIPLSIGIYNRFSVITKNIETGEQKINTSAVMLEITHKGSFGSGKTALGYSVGFSVDFPYMGLGMQTGGAYELTLGLLIPYKKSDVLKCPFQSF
jgi:type IX secretion system PorP/SprF family membrane protein